MVPQSRALTVLLTRPAAQSDRFALALQARFPGVHLVTSPLIAPEYLRPALPVRDWGGVIFTSETGILAARRIAADGYALPHQAFCVGDRTAKVAQAEGFDAVSAQGNGQALVRLVQEQELGGPLLYLHGAEMHIDVGGMLNTAEIETVSAVCYRQKARPLTDAAVQLLQQPDAILVPLFSARTGQILAAEYVRVCGVAPLFVAAISADVGVEIGAADRRVAIRPDATAMLEVMAGWLT